MIRSRSKLCLITDPKLTSCLSEHSIAWTSLSTKISSGTSTGLGMMRELEVRVWECVMMFLLTLEESLSRHMSLWLSMRHRICCCGDCGKGKHEQFSRTQITAITCARSDHKMGGELWTFAQHIVNILGIVSMLAVWMTVIPQVMLATRTIVTPHVI